MTEPSRVKPWEKAGLPDERAAEAELIEDLWKSDDWPHPGEEIDYNDPLTVEWFEGEQGETGEKIKIGSLDDLTGNAKTSYESYSKNGWKGNYSGQTSGTNAGRAWNNRFGDLPTIDNTGNPITYKEFDINNKIPGVARDAERFLVGSDGYIYYTQDHYTTFMKIN